MVLLSIVVIAGVALLGWYWYADNRAVARAQQAEADAARGIEPSANPSQPVTAAAKRERADQLRTAETAGDFKGLVDPVAYRALSFECQKIVDAIVGLLDKPEDSAAFRQSLAEAEGRFSANCVDREAEAKANAATDARNAMETQQLMCKQQQDAAAEYRLVVSITAKDGPDKPGTIDEDKKVRRATLDENQKRLQAFDAYIAANC